MFEPALYILATVLIFLAWMKLQNLTGWFYLNPVVASMFSIIALLLVFDIDYQRYMSGAKYIDFFIEPAVVALGYPLYKQLAMIRKQWRELSLVCCASVLCVLSFSTVLSVFWGLEAYVIKSLVTLNITTAIAMETTEVMGGEPALAACLVLIAGFTGCTLGLHLLKLLGLNEEKGTGLAIGAMSHALGTAVIARRSYVSSAYASTALILCAILTAVIAPLYVPLLLRLLG